MDTMLRRVISLFVVFAIATPLIISETIFPFVVGKAIWFRSMIWILTTFWGLLIIRERKYLPEQNFAFLLFGIVILLQIISAVAGNSLINSFWSNLERMEGIVQSIHLLVFSLILFSIFKTFKEWIFILRSVALVGLLVGFFGFLESFGIFIPNLLNIPFTIVTVDQNNLSLGSTLGNSVFLSWYLSIIIFIVMGLIFYDIKNKGISFLTLSNKTSILNIFTLIFSFWCIFYNFSRGAILSITIGVIFFVVLTMFNSRYKQLKILLAGFLSILFIGTIFILILISRIEGDRMDLRETIVINNIPELIGLDDGEKLNDPMLILLENNVDYDSKIDIDLIEKIISNSLLKSELCREDVLFQKWLMNISGLSRATNASPFRECTRIIIALEKIPGNFTESIMQGFQLGDRGRAIRTGLSAWESSPILGIGPNNFTNAYYKTLSFDDYISSIENVDNPHNSVIKVLSEGGLLGLVSAFLFFGYIFFIIFKKTLISSNRYFWLAISAGFITYFISSLLQVSTLSNQILLIVIISLVIRSSVGFDKKSDFNKIDLKSNNMQILYVVIVFPILIFVLNYHGSIYDFAKNTDKDINVYENWNITENQENVNSFQALSNWPRTAMIAKINANFESFTANEPYTLLDKVISIVDSEYESTMNLHPNNYIAMLEFGSFYFEAAKYRPALADKLRIITSNVEYLSPDIAPTLSMKIKYSIIDRDKEKFTELHKEWKDKLQIDFTYNNEINYFNSYAESFD